MELTLALEHGHLATDLHKNTVPRSMCFSARSLGNIRDTVLFREGGQKDVLVQPQSPYFREGRGTLYRRASHTDACWHQGLSTVHRALLRTTPLWEADRASLGVGWTRVPLEASALSASSALAEKICFEAVGESTNFLFREGTLQANRFALLHTPLWAQDALEGQRPTRVAIALSKRIRRRSGAARSRCEERESRILSPLAKRSLPLKVARDLRRVWRESEVRSPLPFLGYVTVKRRGI